MVAEVLGAGDADPVHDPTPADAQCAAFRQLCFVSLSTSLPLDVLSPVWFKTGAEIFSLMIWITQVYEYCPLWTQCCCEHHSTLDTEQSVEQASNGFVLL